LGLGGCEARLDLSIRIADQSLAQLHALKLENPLYEFVLASGAPLMLLFPQSQKPRSPIPEKGGE
jgi:hypothetical protein